MSTPEPRRKRVEHIEKVPAAYLPTMAYPPIEGPRKWYHKLFGIRNVTADDLRDEK